MAKNGYRLVAPRRMGRIPQGFELKVYTRCNFCPAEEVREAIRRAGFDDYESLSYNASGNWICTEF